MFPFIIINETDTLSDIERRLAKAVSAMAAMPGIRPIYTWNSIKEEAKRLYEQNHPTAKLASHQQ